MSPRSYRQHCALARTLDLVGERWTLLLLRDLTLGPRRFKDLEAGLRGIGPNLLTTRLKSLQAADLVERVTLPGEVTAVYRLTEGGRGLEEALVALARFGLGRLGDLGGDERWSPAWTPLALRASFQPEEARGVEEEYEFRVDGEVFHASVSQGAVKAGAGPAAYPALVLETDAEGFLGLAQGGLSPRELTNRPGTRLEGAVSTLERCHRIFGLPSE